jgi:hypothetical protein
VGTTDRRRDDRGRRRVAGALVATLAAALIGLAPGVIVPAGAAPADDCSAPTRTVAGATDGSSITVAAGEVVALTGTHTGGVDALPTGGTLCVTAGATLAPQYLNNATGTIYVAPAGTITMPSIAVGSGFVLDVAGTATFAGLNVNGPASLHVAAGASLTVTGQFTPAAGTILNEGTLSMPAGGSLNTGVTLSNVGTLTTGGTLTVNGPLENTGVAQITGDLLVNGSGTLHNLCVLTTSGSLTNGSSGSGNTGIVALGGTFTNSGTWRQPSSGALTASTLTGDQRAGRVRGRLGRAADPGGHPVVPADLRRADRHRGQRGARRPDAATARRLPGTGLRGPLRHPLRRSAGRQVRAGAG